MADRRVVLKMAGALVAAGLGSPARGVAAPVRPHRDIDPMALVDPELKPAALEILRNPDNFPPLSDETLPIIRAKIAALMLPPLKTVPWKRAAVPGTAGNPEVTVYVVNAQADAFRPGIVFMHGGGFVFGDAKSTIPELQALSAALDCCIVSVDYRLAPETRFTGSVEDNYASLRWLHANAADLGVDPARIAIMGESAGGGHAALLAIAARDRGEVPLALQVLVYPMLDDRTGSSHQMPDFIGTIGWKADANRYGWRSFLGRAPGGPHVPAAGVPARVSDLSGLAPAFIGVGTLDLFVSEDIEYARRLVEAGVQTELHVYPGAWHGFDHDPAASVAKRFNAAKMDALRRALQIQPPL